jgi:hypothetical protein
MKGLNTGSLVLVSLLVACAGPRPQQGESSYYARYEDVWDAVHEGLAFLYLPVSQEEIQEGRVVTEWITLSDEDWWEYCDCSATDARGSARPRSTQDAIRQIQLTVHLRNLETGIQLRTQAKFRSLEDELVSLPGGRVCMMPREETSCVSTGKIESRLASLVQNLLYPSLDREPKLRPDRPR